MACYGGGWAVGGGTGGGVGWKAGGGLHLPLGPFGLAIYGPQKCQP